VAETKEKIKTSTVEGVLVWTPWGYQASRPELGQRRPKLKSDSATIDLTEHSMSGTIH
jgi:hypothetical protein